MTSIPRSCNPHFLPLAAKPISRKELYISENDSGCESPVDSRAVDALNDAIRRSLPWDEDARRQLKRRKITDEENRAGLDVENDGDSIPFRLVSSVLPPLNISLLPRPPPPPITVEPTCEDNESQAELRRKQAEAAAVDATWIFRESQKPVASWPCGSGKELSVNGKFSAPAFSPNLMLLESFQLPRCTRPPVPLADLNCYPYVKDMNHHTIASRRLPACPTMEVKITIANRKRKRRRRGKQRRVQ